MRIIQSPHGIIIDQTAHINTNILVQWFPDATERVNYDLNPLKEYRKFYISLEENRPDTLSEIHHLEERYLGKFSAHIGKIFHIMQYTWTGIKYTTNSISSYSAAPFTPALQGIKHIIRYLTVHSHHPILYTSGLDSTKSHSIRQETSQIQTTYTPV